jgi:hypothetical protein
MLIMSFGEENTALSNAPNQEMILGYLFTLSIVFREMS